MIHFLLLPQRSPFFFLLSVLSGWNIFRDCPWIVKLSKLKGSQKGKTVEILLYVFAWNNLNHVTKLWDVETNIKTSKLWGKSCLSNNKVGTCQFPRTSVKFTKPFNFPKIAPNFRTTFIPIFSFGFHWNLKNDGKSFLIPAFRSLQPIVGALRRSEKVICIKFSFKLQLPMRAHQRVSRGKKVAPRRRVEVILLIAYIYENFPWNSILFCCVASMRISIFFTSFLFFRWVEGEEPFVTEARITVGEIWHMLMKYSQFMKT